ncbi:hypothetical protein BY998_12313 [Methylobacterium sp. B4]|nr:hypothetical protein BY998_12313 [Methylobacterium sp. B4]
MTWPAGWRSNRRSFEMAEISTRHMTQVMADAIGQVLTNLPSDQRQKAFFLIGATAIWSAEQVKGDSSELVKSVIRQMAHAHVEHALQAIGKKLGLSLPDVQGDGTKRH